MKIIPCYFSMAWHHCGLVTPYGNRDLDQHWLRWLVAWWHQAITWTNVDWSLVKSSDIHIRTISLGMPQPPITKICFKITCLEFHSNFPGASELSGVPSIAIWQDQDRMTAMSQSGQCIYTYKCIYMSRFRRTHGTPRWHLFWIYLYQKSFLCTAKIFEVMISVILLMVSKFWLMISLNGLQISMIPFFYPFRLEGE